MNGKCKRKWVSKLLLAGLLMQTFSPAGMQVRAEEIVTAGDAAESVDAAGLVDGAVSLNMEEGPETDESLNMEEDPETDESLNMEEGPETDESLNMEEGPETEEGLPVDEEGLLIDEDVVIEEEWDELLMEEWDEGAPEETEAILESAQEPEGNPEESAQEEAPVLGETIHTIAVTGMTVPEAGAFPDLTVTTNGTGYRVEGEVEWYVNTGVAKWEPLSPDTPFRQKGWYEPRITLKAEEGYVFAGKTDLQGNVSINGLTEGCGINVWESGLIIVSGDYTIPETSATSPIRFFVEGNQVAIRNVEKGTALSGGVPGQAVIPEDKIPADKELDYWEMTAWTGETYKTFRYYPGDELIALNQSMDLNAVWKWKAGTPLLTQIHITIPEAGTAQLPTSEGFSVQTVPEGAFKKDALGALTAQAASLWMESDDGTTFVQMDPSMTFSGRRQYYNRLIRIIQTDMDELIDTSVVKGRQADLKWYINGKWYPDPDMFRVFCYPYLLEDAEAVVPEQIYTGAALTPEPVVTWKGKTLVKGTDYTVDGYIDNVEIGTGTVVLMGKGNFSGPMKAAFSIVAGGPIPADVITDEVTPDAPALLEAADLAITSMRSEEDVKGASYGLLRVKATAKKKSVTLKWKKVKGADSYIIYGNKCGKRKKYVKLKTVSKTSYTQRRLEMGTYYKYIVVAVKGGAAVSVSKTVHVATGGGSVGNPTKVTLSSKKVTLRRKKTKTTKITASIKTGLFTVKTHRGIAWESSDPGVAKVSKRGKIRAVGKGSCYVYAYAQNGAAARIKVTVK